MVYLSFTFALTYTYCPFHHFQRQKSQNSSFPVIRLLFCLILFQLISFKLFAHAIIHIKNTSLHPVSFPTSHAAWIYHVWQISCFMKGHNFQLALLRQNCLWFWPTRCFITTSSSQAPLSTIFPPGQPGTGEMFDQLNFSTTCIEPPRFALYNIMKIRPFLSEHATQLLFCPGSLDRPSRQYYQAPGSDLKCCNISAF